MNINLRLLMRWRKEIDPITEREEERHGKLRKWVSGGQPLFTDRENILFEWM